MKTSLILLASLMASPFAAAASPEAGNTDCYVNVSQLQLMHGCIYLQGPGPGLCETWQNQGPAFYAPLTRTSANHFEIRHPQLGLTATVDFDGNQSARISIQAPHVNLKETVATSFPSNDLAPQFPRATAATEYHGWWQQTGLSYVVDCNFGLSDAVNAIEAKELAQMDAMGPPAEWADPTAPGVHQLPLGTVLELTQDMDVKPGSETALTTFVEQNGLMTEVGFGKLQLPYRFAYAEFFNANNGYMERAHYPKGMRLQVTKVEMETYSTGGHHFELTLQLLSLPAGFSAKVDPIVRMKVVGRRSGSGEIKIPQLAALLSPAMALELPPN